MTYVHERRVQAFAKWLRGFRDARGQLQKELAHDLGVSRATLNRWEQGHHFPDLDTRLKLNEMARAIDHPPIPWR